MHITGTEFFWIITTCIISALAIGIALGTNLEEDYLKTRYCHNLEAEYHDIRENGVCILPSGEVRDINF